MPGVHVTKFNEDVCIKGDLVVAGEIKLGRHKLTKGDQGPPGRSGITVQFGGTLVNSSAENVGEYLTAGGSEDQAVLPLNSKITADQDYPVPQHITSMTLSYKLLGYDTENPITAYDIHVLEVHENECCEKVEKEIMCVRVNGPVGVSRCFVECNVKPCSVLRVKVDTFLTERGSMVAAGPTVVWLVMS